MRRAALAGLLCAALPMAALGNGTGQDVEIAAPDGLQLAGSYYEGAALGPAVVMLHQCDRDRASWGPAAGALADAGFHVLAMDFRGIGGSVDERARSFHEQHEELWPMFDGDVDRALEFLCSLPGVDTTRVGVIGASCGGTQALLLAERSTQVRAAVFLSSSLPWVSDEELLQFERSRDVPMLGICAQGDSETAARTRALFEQSRDGASRLIVYKGSAHGVPLFEQDPLLVRTIVEFFLATL